MFLNACLTLNTASLFSFLKIIPLFAFALIYNIKETFFHAIKINQILKTLRQFWGTGRR
jgi:hypothetical protein